MKRRKMGSGGLEVSAVGLGCMVMPGFYGPGDEAGGRARGRRRESVVPFPSL